ncbi:MAG: hypothetical protein ABGY71_08605 [bacterium]
MKSTPKLQHQAAAADTLSAALGARGRALKSVVWSSHAKAEVVAAAVCSSQRNVPTKERKETNIAPEATR